MACLSHPNCRIFLYNFVDATFVRKNNKRMKTMNDKEKLEQASSEQPKRPQEPKPPFPYDQEEVLFENNMAGITLAGSLTLPKVGAPFPAVVLISGMGPNDRDYTMLGHKLFLVLADYLTRRGIAVLRFDKRGIGKSTGIYNSTVTSQDLSKDALAAVDYLTRRDDIQRKQIGLIGHSEGGIIAPMVAATSADVAFVVLMAAGVSTSTESITKQVAMQLRADGATQEIIVHDSTIRKQLLDIVKSTISQEALPQMHAAFERYWKGLSEAEQDAVSRLPFAISKLKADSVMNMFNSAWYRHFLNYDPVAMLKQVTVPVLAVNGSCDGITSAALSLPIIAGALKQVHNNDCTTIELSNMNHWFQTCKTGALAEYGTIEETMSLEVMQLIADWILSKVSK